MNIDKFFDDQLAAWPMAASNFEALKGVCVRCIDGLDGVKAQFNPARIASTGAKVDAASLKKRACFLCETNRPKEQFGLDWGGYTVLVNPFPIAPRHFTIPLKDHTPQRIDIADMMALADEMPGYTVFYNGARCGASAPDHMHFQAVETKFLEGDIPAETAKQGVDVVELPGGIGAFVIGYTDKAVARELFDDVIRRLPVPDGDDEPMINVLCRSGVIKVIPRKRHRPSNYGSGEGEIMLSPASIDLSGVMILPFEKDYKAMDAETARAAFAELCYSADELRGLWKPGHNTVSVGIMAEKEIEMVLHGPYLLNGETVTGAVSLGARHFKGEMLFTPASDESYAEVKDVMIGVNFHWQRREVQCFAGAVKIVKDDDRLVLINIIDIEKYLESVISSEMSATSSLELLKAHSVISRSWLLAQIRRDENAVEALSSTEEEADGVKRIVRWYGHDDHSLFDVCADDHCQRYQGMTRATTASVSEAVKATCGEVLVTDEGLVDARFSKCCGGVFEEFQYCWEDTPKAGLVVRRDYTDALDYPDLTIDTEAVKWIKANPEAFCNTNDARVLKQVLNNYDQETADFYRWTVEYDTATLTELVSRKSGIDFGEITGMVPLQRGTSGRITLLRIEGTKATVEVGKELEIRRWLSESHLYSSAFVVEKTDTGFRLRGAGWGHGVGLCQIGAAVMADRGYDYRAILAHYYPGSRLERIN